MNSRELTVRLHNHIGAEPDRVAAAAITTDRIANHAEVLDDLEIHVDDLAPPAIVFVTAGVTSKELVCEKRACLKECGGEELWTEIPPVKNTGDTVGEKYSNVLVDPRGPVVHITVVVNSNFVRRKNHHRRLTYGNQPTRFS